MGAKRKDIGEQSDVIPPRPEDAPAWLGVHVWWKNGKDLRFVMAKELTDSDVFGQQNSLLIPWKDAESRLFLMLSPTERDLIFPPGVFGDGYNLKRTKKESVKKTAAAAAGAGGGLDLDRRARFTVDVYHRSGWRSSVTLRYWPSSTGCVLNGEEYKMITLWSKMKKGDRVQLWAFRDGEKGKLRFVFFRVPSN